MKFKTLSEYSAEIEKSQQAPGLIANLLSEMSAHYSYLSEKHTRYKIVKADWTNKAKFYTLQDGVEVELERPLSDKSVEAKWLGTEYGKEEYRLKYNIKVIEKLMSNLRSILSQRKAEVNNLN